MTARRRNLTMRRACVTFCGRWRVATSHSESIRKVHLFSTGCSKLFIFSVCTQRYKNLSTVKQQPALQLAVPASCRTSPHPIDDASILVFCTLVPPTNFIWNRKEQKKDLTNLASRNTLPMHVLTSASSWNFKSAVPRDSPHIYVHLLCPKHLLTVHIRVPFAV